MLILKHPNANRSWGAPKNWNEERDGPCSTLPTIGDGVTAHTDTMQIMHFAFTRDELAILAGGGSLQLAIHTPIMPVVSFEAVEWPGQQYDDDGHVSSFD